MNIKLTSLVPAEDGYYLVKWTSRGCLHLVLVKTIEGRREIFNDLGKPLYFNEFPDIGFWSERILCVI
jgi:hypothetical protein